MAHLNALRHFSATVENSFDIRMEYNTEKWHGVISQLSHTQQITKSALRIRDVIQHHFQYIELFPSVFKVACKGYDIGGGTAAFMMFGYDNRDKNDRMKCFLFYSRAEHFKTMKAKYSLYEGMDYEIYRET